MPAHVSAGARDDDLLTRLEVAASADDILYILRSDVDLADAKLVGVRMRKYFFDNADDNTVKAACERLHTLDLDC